MTLRRAVVGFVYNEPCPLKCDFCCHTKENVGPGWLTPSKVIPIITDFASKPSVRRFAFTGGDPFIYYKDIVTIFRAARSAGVNQPFHVVTSGFWAKTQKDTEKRLKDLASLGMDLLYVSHDLEHQKWVPAEYIYRIEDACEKFGITLSVYGVFWEKGTTVRDLLPDLRTKHTNETFVSPIGRAREQRDRISKNNPLSDKVSCGRGLNYDITIYPNGDTYPCCSGGFNKEANLLLGNAFVDSASDILDKCFGDFHVIVAKEIGFDKLLARIREGGDMLAIPSFDDISTVCEMCVALRKDPEVRDRIQSYLTEMEVEYCLKSLTKILATATAMEKSNA